MTRRRKSLTPKGRDDDVRMIAGFAIGSILTVIMILVVIIAPPATIGPSEGELAPDLARMLIPVPVGKISGYQILLIMSGMKENKANGY